MDYLDTLDSSLRAYPSLFLDEADVLYHLFLIIGNGYRWENGQLTDGIEDPEEVVRSARASFIRMCDTNIEEGRDKRDFWAKQKALEDEPLEVRQALSRVARERNARKNGEGPDCCVWRDGRVLRRLSLHPEYSKLATVPDDVQPDWLDAAFRAIEAMRGDDWLRTPEQEAQLTEWEESLTKRFS